MVRMVAVREVYAVIMGSLWGSRSRGHGVKVGSGANSTLLGGGACQSLRVWNSIKEGSEWEHVGSDGVEDR